MTTLVASAIAAFVAVLIWLATKIADSVAGAVIKTAGRRFRKYRKRVFSRLSSKRAYKAELAEKLQMMPFLYRLDSYVLSDYADVEIAPLELDTFQIRTTNTRRQADVSRDERLKRARKVLILGSAGMGKTTFQRYTILRLLKSRSDVKLLYEDESPLPIYVPLKAVSNTKPNPIINYIFEAYDLFSGGLGKLRFLDLARKQEIFLFLDGYDEIQLSRSREAHRNYIQEELELLLGPPISSDRPSRGQDIYFALDRCRVWLSSRREFFLHSPIRRRRTEDFIAIELLGIRDSRIDLAQTIFGKYKNGQEPFASTARKLLDAEYFIAEIDSSFDEDFRKASFNPLFLTIMCFIYTEQVIRQNSFKLVWSSTFNSLIEECINLLLSDLDEAKARDLTEAQRAALMRRRNLYVEEKTGFLQYFAAQLYKDGLQVFDFVYLQSSGLSYFTSVSLSDNREKIVRDLTHQDGRRSDSIVNQLIYNGVLVIADIKRGEVLYDFPHRRFRELLASKYFDSVQQGYRFLIEQLDDEAISELLLVFFETTANPHALEELLEAILHKLLSCSNEEYFVSLLANCVRRIRANFDPIPRLKEFLVQQIQSDRSLQMPDDIVKRIATDDSYLRRISRLLDEIFQEQSINAFCLSSDLLGANDATRSELRYRLAQFVRPENGGSRNPLFLLEAYKVLESIDLDYFNEELTNLLTPPIEDYFSTVVLYLILDSPDRTRRYPSLLKGVERRRLTVVKTFLSELRHGEELEELVKNVRNMQSCFIIDDLLTVDDTEAHSSKHHSAGPSRSDSLEKYRFRFYRRWDDLKRDLVGGLHGNPAAEVIYETMSSQCRIDLREFSTVIDILADLCS